MYMDVLPASVSFHCLHAWCLQRLEGGVESPGTGVIDSCKLPCGYQESNSGPIEEQPVLLTVVLSLHPIKEDSKQKLTSDSSYTKSSLLPVFVKFLSLIYCLSSPLKG